MGDRIEEFRHDPALGLPGVADLARDEPGEILSSRQIPDTDEGFDEGRGNCPDVGSAVASLRQGPQLLRALIRQQVLTAAE